MILVNKLRGRIAEKRLKIGDIAKALGMTYKTLYLKMERGVFNSDEIEKLADILEIDIKEYFFAKKELSD